MRQALASGAGLRTFQAIVEAQGGDPMVADDYGRLPVAAEQATLTAPRAGVVSAIDAERIGRAAVALGAGRDRLDAAIDPGAGIEVLAPVGERVAAGDAVLVIAAATPARLDAARALLGEAVTIADRSAAARPLVIDTITAASCGEQDRVS